MLHTAKKRDQKLVAAQLLMLMLCALAIVFLLLLGAQDQTQDTEAVEPALTTSPSQMADGFNDDRSSQAQINKSEEAATKPGTRLGNVRPSSTADTSAASGRRVPEIEKSPGSPNAEGKRGETRDSGEASEHESGITSHNAFVEGEVVTLSDCEPVANALVTYQAPDGSIDVRTNNAGKFRIELPHLTTEETIELLVSHKDYDSEWVEARLGDSIDIFLWKMTRVVVSFTGTAYLPDRAWLCWDSSEHDPAPNWDELGFSEEELETITIELDSHFDVRECRAFVEWFGGLACSEPFELHPGETRHVFIAPPFGATLVISLIGPNAQPMANADLTLIERRKTIDWAVVKIKSDGQGMVTLVGIATPSKYFVSVDQWNKGKVIGTSREVTFASAVDRKEVVFDLSDSGIVDHQLTADGCQLDIIVFYTMEGNFIDSVAHRGRPSLAFGLKPGRYRVEIVQVGSNEIRLSGEYEVLPAPAISQWRHDYKLNDKQKKVLRHRVRKK